MRFVFTEFDQLLFVTRIVFNPVFRILGHYFPLCMIQYRYIYIFCPFSGHMQFGWRFIPFRSHFNVFVLHSPISNGCFCSKCALKTWLILGLVEYHIYLLHAIARLFLFITYVCASLCVCVCVFVNWPKKRAQISVSLATILGKRNFIFFFSGKNIQFFFSSLSSTITNIYMLKLNGDRNSWNEITKYNKNWSKMFPSIFGKL